MVDVDVIISDDTEEALPIEAENLADYAARVMLSSGVDDGEINVVFVGDAFMTELNETYKKRSGSTDVLSFILSGEDSERIEGEVYVSLKRAQEQAVEYGVTFSEEIVRLVTHGLLHLAGCVHGSDEEYRVMTKDTERYVMEYFKRGE